LVATPVHSYSCTRPHVTVAGYMPRWLGYGSRTLHRLGSGCPHPVYTHTVARRLHGSYVTHTHLPHAPRTVRARLRVCTQRTFADYCYHLHTVGFCLALYRAGYLYTFAGTRLLRCLSGWLHGWLRLRGYTRLQLYWLPQRFCSYGLRVCGYGYLPLLPLTLRLDGSSAPRFTFGLPQVHLTRGFAAFYARGVTPTHYTRALRLHTAHAPVTHRAASHLSTVYLYRGSFVHGCCTWFFDTHLWLVGCGSGSGSRYMGYTLHRLHTGGWLHTPFGLRASTRGWLRCLTRTSSPLATHTFLWVTYRTHSLPRAAVTGYRATHTRGYGSSLPPLVPGWLRYTHGLVPHTAHLPRAFTTVTHTLPSAHLTFGLRGSVTPVVTSFTVSWGSRMPHTRLRTHLYRLRYVQFVTRLPHTLPVWFGCSCTLVGYTCTLDYAGLPSRTAVAPHARGFVTGWFTRAFGSRLLFDYAAHAHARARLHVCLAARYGCGLLFTFGAGYFATFCWFTLRLVGCHCTHYGYLAGCPARFGWLVPAFHGSFAFAVTTDCSLPYYRFYLVYGFTRTRATTRLPRTAAHALPLAVTRTLRAFLYLATRVAAGSGCLPPAATPWIPGLPVVPYTGYRWVSYTRILLLHGSLILGWVGLVPHAQLHLPTYVTPGFYVCYGCCWFVACPALLVRTPCPGYCPHTHTLWLHTHTVDYGYVLTRVWLVADVTPHTVRYVRGCVLPIWLRLLGSGLHAQQRFTITAVTVIDFTARCYGYHTRLTPLPPCC